MIYDRNKLVGRPNQRAEIIEMVNSGAKSAAEAKRLFGAPLKRFSAFGYGTFDRPITCCWIDVVGKSFGSPSENPG
jgi:hypothetical protein